MLWVAITENDEANHVLERRLWQAADQVRANSDRKAGQYSAPVLGLIFLRFDEARFTQRRTQVEKAEKSSRPGSSRIDDPAAYHVEGGPLSHPGARFDDLLKRPDANDVGKAVNEAVRDVEKQNPKLSHVLPQTYSPTLKRSQQLGSGIVCLRSTRDLMLGRLLSGGIHSLVRVS
jgi:type I restriction enzyme M protein